jgi:chloride channel protein, CIC family
MNALPAQPRAVLRILLYGLGGGVAAVAFQLAMNQFYRATYVKLATQSHARFLTGTFLLITTTSLIVGWLLNSFSPTASGSGIPQVKLVFWKNFGVVPWRVTWVKFLAGVLSIGGGSSLGREGPSVQIGAGVASNLAGVLGEAKQSRRVACAAGAAAGLAAAFNTPIAAVTFVLEEIIQDLNSPLLGRVLLAAVAGAFVTHGIIGRQPAFAMADVEPSSWQVYLLVPLVAALATLVGFIFQKLTLEMRGQRKASPVLPLWFRPVIGGVITWLLGSAVFLKTGSLGVFALGYDDLSRALTENFPWRLAALLLATKLIATIACYGFGSCGGIFSPTLFLGGMCGTLIGGMLGPLLHFSSTDTIVLAVIGMGTCLGSVVRAPVTGILIVFEMTHEFSLVPGLIVGTLVSLAITRRLSKHSFYEAILVQDGHRTEHVVPPRDLRAWQQLPVSAIARANPVVVGDLGEAALKKLLAEHLFKQFPVVQDGKLMGLLSRDEASSALSQRRTPKVFPATACLPTQSIREIELLLIDAPAHVLVVLDQPEGKVAALLTLHDLLRAEIAYGQG